MMVSFFRLTQLISALGLAGCAAATNTQTAIPPSGIITPLQLIASAAEQEGERASVQGYFTYVTDTRALWESATAATDAQEQRLGPGIDYWAKCVTVYPANGDARRFNRRLVVVTGSVAIINEQDGRSLWTCNAVAIENAVITRQ